MFVCLKMHPKSDHKLFLFIQFQATILSIYFPTTFFCAGESVPYITPNVTVIACSVDPFNCGSIGSISYPFWGGSRALECGRKGFELVCQDGVPLLNISSLSYRVQKIDFQTNILRVAREDLQNNMCPEVLHSTTIDLDLFEYPPKSDDENITLYFDCTADQSPVETLPNKFTCGVKSGETFNLFKTGDASSGSGPGRHITCNNNISVPINQKDARSLEYPTASSINIVKSALATGFSVQWLSDSLQHSAPYCNPEVYSSCSTGSVTPVIIASPAPEERQGSPRSESPRSSAKGDAYNAQIGKGKHPAKVTIAVVALSISIVMIVSITIYCFLKRRHSTSVPHKEGIEKFLFQNGSLTPKRYKYSEIKKITKSFSDKLGQGGYGSVYKGMLPDGCPVAVKVLTETDGNGEEFINEVASISRTSHVNIVSLLGFCYDGNKRALVYEFMPNKSLDKFLSNDGSAADTNCCLDLEELYNIALGIAKGLEYLHSGCSTRIVHFDIKPQNILLDEDFCPKISDFGLAKLCKKKQSVLSVLGTRGTIGYIAPEVFSRNFGGVSHKSDVYSYGMMLLEMAGARKIVETEVDQSSENYFPDKIYEQVVIDVTKKLDDFMFEEKEETRWKMFLVGFWCIQTNPADRPSISKAVEMLEGGLRSIQIPPKPVLFSAILPGQEISSSFAEYVETEDSAQD